MQAETTLTSPPTSKLVAIWSAAMIGLMVAAFAQGQAVVAESLAKVVERGDLPTLRARLSSGENPNEPDDSAIKVKGWTPLMAAAYSGNIEAARILLDAGATLNAKTEFGRTALDVAVVGGKPQVAELLRSRGAKDTVAAPGVASTQTTAGQKAKPAAAPAQAIAPTPNS